MRVFITGGTGSLGTALAERMLPDPLVARITIYSRDEVKQAESARLFKDDPQDKMRYFLGDVRDERRLTDAITEDTDLVVHAAALKRVDSVSYNPTEVLLTNVIGTSNVLRVARHKRVKRVIFVSSDKAVHPANVYGATKLLGEFITIRSNVLSAPEGTISSVVRYGNVWGSRGSVIHEFQRQLNETGEITVTDLDVTRFYITLPQAVDLIQYTNREMEGGEIFVPKLRAWGLGQIAALFSPARIRITGMRPGGEKVHEQLIANEETDRVRKAGEHLAIIPELREWTRVNSKWVDPEVDPEYTWSPFFPYTSDHVNLVHAKELTL
jgi:UDP-N-acetylglucosamine 4,6-dehydratase